MLVDIVSKNGNLVLNIPQRPDGTLDDECTYLLAAHGRLDEIQRRRAFRHAPWEKAGEGPGSAPAGAFQEKSISWTTEDFRFTKKGETLYAFQMHPSETGTAVIRALATGQSRRVADVRLLGGGAVPFSQSADGLTLDLPPSTSEGPQGIAITQE